MPRTGFGSRSGGSSFSGGGRSSCSPSFRSTTFFSSSSNTYVAPDTRNDDAPPPYRERSHVCKCSYVGKCFVLLAACFSLAFFVSMSVHRTSDVELADLEQIVFYLPGPFHSGLTIEQVSDPDFTMVALYESLPALRRTPVRREKKTLILSYDKYQWFAYLLAPDSEISVNYQAESPVDFYLLIGKSNFLQWTRGEGRPTKHIVDSHGEYKHVVGRHVMEDVYFVWENKILPEKQMGQALFTIDATWYPRYSPMQVCASYPCTLPINYHSSEVVIIEGLDTHRGNDMFTENNMRTVYYHTNTKYTAVIFFQVLLLTIACLSLAVCLCTERYATMLGPAPPPYSPPAEQSETIN